MRNRYQTLLLVFAFLVVYFILLLSAETLFPVVNAPWPVAELAFLGGVGLLWPALVAARLGLPASWLVLVVLVLGMILARYRFGMYLTRLRWSLGVSSYWLMGVLYIFVLPVPYPDRGFEEVLAGISVNSFAVNREEFDWGYEMGYRRGMVNLFIVEEGGLSRSFVVGFWTGYSFGAGEWIRACGLANGLPSRASAPGGRGSS